jgi:hypothetical protein
LSRESAEVAQVLAAGIALVTILTLFQLRISIVAQERRCYNGSGAGPEIFLKDLALFVYLGLRWRLSAFIESNAQPELMA